MPKLEARNLSKHLSHTLLWHINKLELTAGECVHLRGENGSGKTTLLKILAGLQKADTGQVLINQQPVKPGSQICYLHQQPYMFDRSVRNNLNVVIDSGVNTAQERNRLIDQSLCWAGLQEQAEQPARTLSGGERQALAMARAWLCAPTFWLLDEPTASLDEQGVWRCVELVSRLREQGAGILLTTHQPGPLTDLCDQQWLIQKQQLITDVNY